MVVVVVVALRWRVEESLVVGVSSGWVGWVDDVLEEEKGVVAIDWGGGGSEESSIKASGKYASVLGSK